MSEQEYISANKQDAMDCHAELKKMYPLYADGAREIAIRYLKRYDRNKLAIYLGETSEFDTTTGLSYVRQNLQESMFFLCSLLEDEANSNPNLTPLIKDFFIRLYLGLPYRVIEGSISTENIPTN